MALAPREKRLATIVGVMAGAMAIWFAVSGVWKAFDSRNTQREAMRRDLQQKQFRTAQAMQTLERFAEWERRSLPSNREVARTLYQGWLLGTLAEAQLGNVQVDPGRTIELRGVYMKMPFSVRAQGSLSAMSRWLAAFYRVDHLHQLRDWSLKPIGKGSDLQLTATIEALILPEADRTDKLTTLAGGRLDETRATTAMQTIAERNLFAPYVPPPPPAPPVVAVSAPPPPPPPVFDEAKYTFLTSVVSVSGEAEAWLTVRPTKQLLKLRTGDGIKVGRFEGTLTRIGRTEIEVEQDGKRRTVALGTPLNADGAAVVGGS